MQYNLPMRVISNRRLVEFSAKHKDSQEALQAWRKLMEFGFFKNFSQLKDVFTSADKVRDLYVFNICGNKYRLVTYLQFERQLCYIKAVLTHKDYDKDGWKK
jgi:mRNA interferase HigB